MAKGQADIVAAFGASGSGKTLFVRQEIMGARRLIVFDSMAEYSSADGVLVVQNAAALLASVSKREFRVAFVPSKSDTLRAQQFAFVCDVAFRLGTCKLVVEELRFLTRPGWAPMEWARITSQGRHKGLSVIGTSQRPASVDKDFVGNCTRVRSGRLVFEDDSRAVARVLRVKEGELLELPPLSWIERDLTKNTIKKGKVIPPVSR